MNQRRPYSDSLNHHTEQDVRMASEDPKTYYTLFTAHEEGDPYNQPLHCSRKGDCNFPPPEFEIPPPPRPPWLSPDESCLKGGKESEDPYFDACDNPVLVDPSSRLRYEDTIQNVLVIIVCSVLLVVIVLVIAVIVWRRRTRFLRSLINDERKTGEDEGPKIPPLTSNDIELRENPDTKHVFTNPNYPHQTINIGGLPFYLLPAKDSNIDESGGSYVSSSVLTIGPIYEDIVDKTTPEAVYYNSSVSPAPPPPPPPPPTGPRSHHSKPSNRPDSGGPSSSHCTSSSEISIDSNTSPMKHVVINPNNRLLARTLNPSHSPSPPARTGVYYYSDTLRNNPKSGRGAVECESDSGISNSRTSTEESTPPSRHGGRNGGRKPSSQRRPVDTEVSVKSYKGSVQV